MFTRTRVLLLTPVLAIAGLFLPADPVLAAGPALTVSLTCDAVGNTITAQASGNNVAGARLSVTFQVVGGSYATATTDGFIAAYGQQATASATVDAAGAWSATGYTRPWPATDYLFYTEKVRVTARNPATGAQWGPIDESCYRDVRTTVNAACDTGTHTINVNASAVQYARPPVVSVRYYRVKSYWQANANDPWFIGSYPQDPPIVSRSVRPNADGTWSDPGYSQAGSAGYYGALEFVVEVWKTGAAPTYLIGRGQVLCVYADERPPPPAA
jgi:hypothetical protein